jgi:hypothetical protein
MELHVYILDMLSLSFAIYYLHLVVKFLTYNTKAAPKVRCFVMVLKACKLR